MKKCLLILILLSYSIASFGVSLNYFYCCGKLKTVTITKTTAAEKCTGNKKKDCCKNKKVHIQLKTDQQQNTVSTFNFASPIILNHHFDNFKIANNIVHLNNDVYSQFKKPPSLSLIGANILFCTFRI